MFHVGQKIVCVKEYGQQREAAALGVILPQKGSIYTVRNFDDRGASPALRVHEILNPEVMHGCGIFTEPAFASHGFRPIIEKKTDISIFTAMLTPSPARSRELCGND